MIKKIRFFAFFQQRLVCHTSKPVQQPIPKCTNEVLCRFIFAGRCHGIMLSRPHSSEVEPRESGQEMIPKRWQILFDTIRLNPPTKLQFIRPFEVM
jgi:hypothetical protein